MLSIARATPPGDVDLDAFLYAFANYELDKGRIVPEKMVQARQGARQDEDIKKAYTRLRFQQLRQEVGPATLQTLDRLDHGFSRWRSTAQATPGEYGSAWDDLMHQIHAEATYKHGLRATARDTLLFGGTAAGFVVLAFIIGLVLGPAHPLAALITISLLLLVWWIAFGLLQLGQRGS